MDAESDVLLFTVIKLLFEQKKCCIDELFLEKLLNEIENAQIENPSLLTDLNLHDLVQNIVQHDVDQRVKSFGLRLIGLQIAHIYEMDETEVQAVHKLLSQLKRSIQKSSCPAVIKSSTLVLLRKLIGNDDPDDLIAKTGMLSLAVTLLSDCSIFVCHEAAIFLSAFLIRFLSRSRPEAVELLHHLLETFDKKSNIHFTHSMMIFERVCKCYSNPKIETLLLNLLLVEDDEFICKKLCEVLVVIQDVAKDYSNVDAILKKLTTSDFVDIAVKFCADMLSRNLHPGEIPKLETYLLFAIDSLNNKQKTGKKLEAISLALSKLNITVLSDEFQVRYGKWLCNFASEAQTEMPKLTISLLNKLSDIYHHSNLNIRILFKDTIGDIINSRMACDAVLVKALTVYGHLCKDFDDVQTIGKSISCLLYHPNWAVQDSVLELIGQFVSDGTRGSCDCVLSNNLHATVWEKMAVENCESYIRATGLRTLSYVIRVPELWHSLDKMFDESKIVNQVMMFVATDSEVVVRRAATQTLACLYKSGGISHKWKVQLQSTMQVAVRDLDWEVKLISLQFWKEIEKQVQSENNLHIYKFIARLDNFGFCFALMSAIDDCDSTVQLEAASILKPIQKQLQTSDINRTIDAINAKRYKENPLVTTTNMADICQPVDIGVMEAVLNMCDSEAVKRTIRSPSDVNDEMHNVTEKVVIAFGSDKFISAVLDLNLEKVEMAANANADIYEGNLQLLLMDILMMHKKSGAADVILDCY